MTTTPIVPDEIKGFADAVRAELEDLSQAERDELTGDLEVDLAEAYAESAMVLPDPAEYADELRAAAGLPTATALATSAAVDSAIVRAFRQWTSTYDRAVARPEVARVLTVGRRFRPLWWAFRGYALWALFNDLQTDGIPGLPYTSADAAGLIAVVVASIVIGSGFSRVGRAAILVTNVLVVLTLPLTVSLAVEAAHAVGLGEQYDQLSMEPASGPDFTGLWVDGSRQVFNIFAYDKNGKPLKDVQLFDQDGDPITTVVDGADGCVTPTCEETGYFVPTLTKDGEVVWNVFPLRLLTDARDDGMPSDARRPAKSEEAVDESSKRRYAFDHESGRVDFR